MPPHFPAMVQAELQAVFRRGSGKGALIASLLVSFAVVAFLKWVAIKNGEGAQAPALIDLSLVGALGTALRARNFFIIPLFLVLGVGATVADEMHDNTLREVLVRPVSRISVLGAKLIALVALSGATLLLTFLPTLALGALALGADGSPADVSLGYLAAWASDLGLIAITLVPAVFLRGSGAVVLGVVLTLIADFTLRYAFKAIGAIAEKFGQEELAKLDEVAAWFPGQALACWEGWKDGFNPAQFGGLALLTALCIAVATARFLRRDFA